MTIGAKLLPLLLIGTFSFAAPIEDAPQRNSALDHLRYSIMHDEPHKTLEELKKYPDKTNYFYFLYSGNTLLTLANPRLAVTYYKIAYTKATNYDEKKAALFGITRCALWLEYYPVALNAFNELSSMPLTKEDQEIVNTGRVTSFTNTDYPRIAFNLFENQKTFNYPTSIIAGTKAALAAGWGYKAKAIWEANTPLIQQIPSHSYLDNQRTLVNWLIKQQTSKKSAGVDFYTIQDSANFKVQRESAFASYRLFGINSNTTVTELKNQYFDPIIMAKANIVSFRQDFINIDDRLDVNLIAAPAHITYRINNQASWNPILWNGGMTYHLNDYWVFSAYNSNGLVETIPALQNAILINTSEGSIFFHPYPKLYVRGSGFHNLFTNHNNRNGGAGSINYQLISELGLFSELRYRGYHNSFYNDPNYFSPYRLQEGMLFLMFKRRLSTTLTIYAEGGIGTQSILQAPSATTTNNQVLAYNLNLSKQIGTVAELNLNGGYTQNAFSNFIGAYAQTYFGASIKFFLE